MYVCVYVREKERWAIDDKNKGTFQDVANPQKDYFIIRIKP